jgi:hypothetical protein
LEIQPEQTRRPIGSPSVFHCRQRPPDL